MSSRPTGWICNSKFDSGPGFFRLAGLLAAAFLPFVLFVIALFNPGGLGGLLTSPWFYFSLFMISIVVAAIAQGDRLRAFGHSLSARIPWFEGWKGLLRRNGVVLVIGLPVAWICLFFHPSGTWAKRETYANATFMAQFKFLVAGAFVATSFLWGRYISRATPFRNARRPQR